MDRDDTEDDGSEVDESSPSMKSFGSYFKQKREDLEISLDEVAEQTNISRRHLQAIEDEDFSKFPADVYAKGFIRTYADFLGLDSDALVMEYSLNSNDSKDTIPGEDGRTKYLYWAISIIVIIAVTSILLIRLAWRHPRPSSRTDLPSQSSSEFLNDLNTTKGSGSGKTPTQIAPVENTADTDTLKLSVKAIQQTWVYAVFDGMAKKEYMLQAGDKTVWEAKDTIRLRLGNAGGIRLYFNGKLLPSLGKPGEVTDKLITLDDGKLKIKTLSEK